MGMRTYAYVIEIRLSVKQLRAVRTAKSKKILTLGANNKRYIFVLFVVSFMTIGASLTLFSKAATPVASFEAEVAVKTAPAAIVTDSNASGGSAVKFGINSSQWALIYQSDLKSEPVGTEYSTGVRTTDESYNRRQQVTYDANGMTITAERLDKIYSAGVLMKGFQMPTYHAVEADVTLYDYLGVGMFPAMWERPTNDSTGERDIWEYCGGYVGDTNEWKTTWITTPYGENQGQVVDRNASKIEAVLGTRYPLNQEMHWRFENTPNLGVVYLNGVEVGRITKAAYDSSKRKDTLTNLQYDTTNFAGSRWSQFEENKTWYPRFTYQIGVGTKANNAGETPANWTKSQMRIRNLKIYELNS